MNLELWAREFVDAPATPRLDTNESRVYDSGVTP